MTDSAQPSNSVVHPCGNIGGSDPLTWVCDLQSGHEGWHQDSVASWPERPAKWNWLDDERLETT